ncbi:MAG: TetR/AcrR family transcriptional regulator [Alphaproteobacteria bacterium]|nr:TetR/AcrR family transcriptional regulator [Alphaproteobacteria bacterium]
MRRSKSEKAQSREEIVNAAARLFREKGIGETSVSDVMGSAGLTHGGFYRHFSSKEDLAATAIRDAFRSGLRVFTEASDAPEEEARAYVDQYLSHEHLTDPGDGCPIPTMAAEAGRGPDSWRASLAAGAEEAIAKLSVGLPGGRPAALELLALLVGTVLLTRGTGDTPLAGEVLDTGRAASDRLLSGD